MRQFNIAKFYVDLGKSMSFLGEFLVLFGLSSSLLQLRYYYFSTLCIKNTEGFKKYAMQKSRWPLFLLLDEAVMQ